MNTFIFNKHNHLIINIIDDDNDDYEEEDTKDNVCQNDDNDNVDVNEHCEKNMSHHTQKKLKTRRLMSYVETPSLVLYIIRPIRYTLSRLIRLHFTGVTRGGSGETLEFEEDHRNDLLYFLSSWVARPTLV